MVRNFYRIFFIGFLVTCRLLVRQKRHRTYYIRKVVLENFTILTGKYLCWSLFFNYKHRCFPVSISKILRTPILKNTCTCECLPLARDLSLEVVLFSCFNQQNTFYHIRKYSVSQISILINYKVNKLYLKTQNYVIVRICFHKTKMRVIIRDCCCKYID